MKVGTKSVLFGVHCFFIHPIVVFVAWTKLYGFPFDPRLWLAFCVHDIGYYGKPNMDGAEGEIHVELGARIMGVFGKKWADFSRYHSRFYAKRDGVSYSKLCVADKYAICIEPAWMYLPRANWSGEIKEYMKLSEAMDDKEGKYESMKLSMESQKQWHKSVVLYLRKWVTEHKDGKVDDWTPNIKKAIDKNGVWK